MKVLLLFQFGFLLFLFLLWLLWPKLPELCWIVAVKKTQFCYWEVWCHSNMFHTFFFSPALSVEILRLFHLQCLDALWLCALVWVIPCAEYLMCSFNEDKWSIFWYYFTDNYLPSVYCFVFFCLFVCLLYPISFSWILFSHVLGCQDWSFVSDTLFSTFHFLCGGLF